jgi:hypothetical protein
MSETPEDDRKIISIKTRQPIVKFIEPTEEELEAAIAEEDRLIAEERAKIIAGQLEGIDKLRKLVETGLLGAIVVCGQMIDDPTLFYNDVIVGDPLDPNDAVPFLGALDLLKGEMTELAYMAEIITADGTITKPIIQLDEDFDDYDA